MNDHDLPECTCPLIDVSTYGQHGIELAFVLGDPRGSGCAIHETEDMRNERRDAEDIARYGSPRRRDSTTNPQPEER